jgi:hypothetical protein
VFIKNATDSPSGEKLGAFAARMFKYRRMSVRAVSVTANLQ